MSSVQKSCRLLKSGYTVSKTFTRTLFNALRFIPNQYDKSRVDEVGPDMACAEWVLRCGGSMKWLGSKAFVTDYNSLPPPDRALKVEEIDGTKSIMMANGFRHLQGMQHLRKIILHDCKYIKSNSLLYFTHIESSLEHLELVGCGKISDDGLNYLVCLKNLKYLLLKDLPGVVDKQTCLDDLKDSLPKCDISFPDIEQGKT